MKLTDASVVGLKLPEGKSELLVFDGTLPGFGVRLRAGGKRTWVVQYRLGHQQRRLSLGTVQPGGAIEARKRAKDAIARVQLGQDPQAEKINARVPKARELTLNDVIERYLPHAERRLKASTYSGVVLHLRKHWSSLHAYELQNLERRHVAAELSRIAASSGPYGANRSRAALSSLFAWAIGEGLTDANPVVGTNKATDEIARDRVLSDNEIGLVWQHAGAGQYGAIVRLLLLTGQRREEVAAMQWSELDLDKGVWSLPASRTKNGRPHDVPLSHPAIEILLAQEKQPDREFVFGEAAGPFQGWSKAKNALDNRLQGAGMTAPWRLHDLRRTAATRMADLGVQPHVIEAVLNHTSGHKSGVAGIYNRATYSNEKRMALALWADHVAAVANVAPRTVVPLRASGRA
ncbi:MAG TPA: tyrosine-type recombinase/integrase [Methylocella sp.]|jgi:integrase